MTHYSIEPHSQEWVIKFSELKEVLLNVFGNKVVSIEHVGSTSISGIKAKPIIDVLMLIEDVEDIKSETKHIESMGYVVRENVLAERSFLFEKISGDTKEQNIHIFEKGAPYAQNHFISIRDYLRVHPEVAKEYETLKSELYKKYPEDYQAYRAGKDGFLKRLEKAAGEWNNKIK